jgi:DNA polymerase-3 subunit alpha
MGYLKVHYPLEYFTVLLSTSENSMDKVAIYVQSARAIGIQIIPPSINTSEYSFQIKNKGIIFGFNNIKGVGNETINKIIEARNSMPSKTFSNYTEGIAKLCNAGVGLKAIETLIKAGTFDSLLQGKTRFFLISNLSEIYEKVTTITVDGEFIIKPELREFKETPEIRQELIDQQFRLLGVSFTEQPIVGLKQKYQGEYQIQDLMEVIDSTNVMHCLIKLVSHRIIKTKTGSTMAFARIEDNTKILDVAIFPGVFEKVKSILINNRYFIVTIR